MRASLLSDLAHQDLRFPPKDVAVMVHVLQDYPDLQTETGVYHLRRGMRLNLPRDVVEGLIKKGIVEVIP
jgi:hypothetical protein